MYFDCGVFQSPTLQTAKNKMRNLNDVYMYVCTHASSSIQCIQLYVFAQNGIYMMVIFQNNCNNNNNSNKKFSWETRQKIRITLLMMTMFTWCTDQRRRLSDLCTCSHRCKYNETTTAAMYDYNFVLYYLFFVEQCVWVYVCMSVLFTRFWF